MSLSLLFHRIAFPAWHHTEPRRRRTTNVRKRAPISRKPSAGDSRLPRKLLETFFDKNCQTIPKKRFDTCPKKRFDTCLHNLSFFTQTCDSCLICLCVMLASLRTGSPFIHRKFETILPRTKFNHSEELITSNPRTYTQKILEIYRIHILEHACLPRRKATPKR